MGTIVTPTSEVGIKQTITTRLNKLFVKDLEKSLARQGCVSECWVQLALPPDTQGTLALGPLALMKARKLPSLSSDLFMNT